MRNALLIFQKDVRHLWPRALPLLAFTVLLAWLECKFVGAGPLFGVVRGFWLLCSLFLISSAVHEEHLPGHQQYWLTRPYARRDLLLSKGFFLAVFVFLPALAIECASLAANGLSPFHNPPRLFMTVLIFSVATGIVFAALAAVTENLVQLLWALLPGLGIPLVGFLNSADQGWGDYTWVWIAIFGLAVLLLAAAALTLQYFYRNTMVSRCLIGAAILVVSICPWIGSWHAARSLFRISPDSALIHIELDPAGKGEVSDVGIALPVLVSGIPAESEPMIEGIQATLDVKGGTSWSTGWTKRAGLSNPLPGDPGVQRRTLRFSPIKDLKVDRAVYRNAANQPLHLRLDVALILFSDHQVTPLPQSGRSGILTDGGFCISNPGPFDHLIVSCAWPDGAPPFSDIRVKSLPSGASFFSFLSLRTGNPFSLDGSIWDKEAALISAPQGKLEVNLETWRTARRFDRVLEIPEIRLVSPGGLSELR